MRLRSRIAASVLSVLAATSLWLSLGTLAVSGGEVSRLAVLPSPWILSIFIVVAVAAAVIGGLHLEHAWPLAVSGMVWLPFVSPSAPASFLMWQGPLEVFIWLVVAAGMVAVRKPAVPAVLARPDRAPWIAALMVGVSSLVVFSQVRDVIPGGDEPHYLAATQSLLKDADLRVANNYASGDYLDYFPGRLEPHFLTRSVSGEIYSIHAPGVSIVVLPAFAVAGYAGAVVTMALIAALSAALAWLLAFRLSSSVAGSWVGTLAVFLTAPYFFHTFTIYPEVIGGACVLCGLWLLLELDEGKSVSTRALVAVGASLALLPWLHSRFAVLAGAIGLIVAPRLMRRPAPRQALSAFLSVPVTAGVAWFVFFQLIWGSPSPMAPYGADASTSLAYAARGVIGLIVDQQFGVLTTAPIYAVVVLGAIYLFKQRTRLAVELMLIVSPYVVLAASYAMWWAGSAAPARFLVAILPLAALPIALAWKEHRSAFVALLLLSSVALTLPRAFVEDGRFIFNNRGGIDGTLAWLSQIIDLPFALPSVHRDGAFAALRDAAVWVSVFVAASAAASLARRSIAAAWAASGAALLMAATMAVAIVGDFHGVDLVTSDRSKLAAVAAYRPWLHDTLVDLSSGRAMDRGEFFGAMAITMSGTGTRLNRVPAGDYDLSVTVTPGNPGPLTVFVGRNDPPIASPQLDDLRAGQAPFRLHLPVAVNTLNLMAREDVGAGAPWLLLRPAGISAASSPRYATRATRYGTSRAFFFDDWAYLERDGFWTRANGSATVVIDNDDPNGSGLPISVTAGAVPTTVRLSVGAWQQSLSLAAGEKQEVVLPPASDGKWTLHIRSGAGFRPSEREPGNRDVRELSAWIAVLSSSRSQ